MKTFLLAMMAMCVVVLARSPVIAQEEVNDDAESKTTEVLPPPEIRDWTPLDNQFQLYVNFDGEVGDRLPRIDILNDKQESCLFWMEKLGDTLYIFILPPGYTLKDSVRVRNRVDGLDDEFPFTVMAGTKRAAYWFSHDSGQVVLDTLQSEPFITVVALHELPANVLTLQLEGKNKNAKAVRELVKELKGQAELIQLDEGFYRNIWFKVKKTVVQNFKTNETKTGTFLAFKCADGQVESVSNVLQKYRGEYAAAH